MEKQKLKKILATSAMGIMALAMPFSVTGCTTDDDINVRVNGEYIQWQVEGNENWTNLLTIDEVKDLLGESYKGDTGAKGDQGIPGINGKEVEFGKNETHVQWRYVGDSEWKNLFSFEELTEKENSDVDTLKTRGFDLFQSKLFNMDTLDYKIDYTYEDGAKVVESFRHYGVYMAGGVQLNMFFAVEQAGGKFSLKDEDYSEYYDSYSLSAIAESCDNYMPDRSLVYSCTYNIEEKDYDKFASGGTMLYDNLSAGNNQFDYNYIKELKAFTKESIINCEFNNDGDCKILFKYCNDGGSKAGHEYLKDDYLFEFNITKDGWIVKCNVYEKDFLNGEVKGDLFCRINYKKSEGTEILNNEFIDSILKLEKDAHPEITDWEDVFTNETFM